MSVSGVYVWLASLLYSSGQGIVCVPRPGKRLEVMNDPLFSLGS